MHNEVTIIFNAHDQMEFDFFSHDNSEETRKAARIWLENKWEELECEPLRPSGKVLLLDRILSIADALGYHWCQAHPKEAQEFAEQCALALDSVTVTIDLPNFSISSN
ncbi:hypothetical protein [Pelistega europaea]|uniref:Uncharacterized protein n=1 Tax=Pelistega europaea TaxID=106147 RepID=A0A7Y4P6X2_9BURK|nr:hypothetical protein [Pelistega europaea]NOL50160.1 hypothetical protein [Pelistega europaea]